MVFSVLLATAVMLLIKTPGQAAETPANLGDGGPAAQASLNEPYGVAVDAAGNVYIADTGNRRLRKVDAKTGVISTIAGGGARIDENIPANESMLRKPVSVVVDSVGNVFFIDDAQHVRKIDAKTGQIAIFIGGGDVKVRLGRQVPAADVSLGEVQQLAVDKDDNLYATDASGYILKCTMKTGMVIVVAGSGPRGYSGDGDLAISATLNRPNGVAVDSQGNIYFSDQGNYAIRRVDVATGIITTVSGARKPTVTNTLDKAVDGKAIDIYHVDPIGVAVDVQDNFYICAMFYNRVCRVDAKTGMLSTIAGNGEGRFAGDGGPAKTASLSLPSNAACDAQGNLYIADSSNNCIRKIDAQTGVISTIAGTGGPAGN